MSDWLPQQDILAHPNLKVFITHAGQSSMQELLCHQKPALAVPVQGDQPLNAKELVRMEVGISVPYPSLNEDDLYQVIHTKAMKSSYFLGPFWDIKFWRFSLLEVKTVWVL